MVEKLVVVSISDTFINWGLSVCLSEAAEESGFLLKFHNEDRVGPILDQQKAFQGRLQMCIKSCIER